MTIHKNAKIEATNLSDFLNLKELWSEKIHFKLAKHFPIKVFETGKILYSLFLIKFVLIFHFHFDCLESFQLSSARSSINKKLSATSRISELRSISKQQVDDQNQLIESFSYKLVDINQIRYFYDVIFC
jgi:hypothetical protein